MKKKFALGRIVSTPGILERIAPAEMLDALKRHATGDWGDCCKEDAAANEQALEDGSRIFSVYHDQHGTKFWIITEAVSDDGREETRASTCVLLPSEY